jgi:hypothetical protein
MSISQTVDAKRTERGGKPRKVLEFLLSQMSYQALDRYVVSVIYCDAADSHGWLVDPRKKLGSQENVPALYLGTHSTVRKTRLKS